MYEFKRKDQTGGLHKGDNEGGNELRPDIVVVASTNKGAWQWLCNYIR